MAIDRVIKNVGGHYFESIGGKAHVVAGDVIHSDQAQQLSQEITPESSTEDILTLLAAIHQELGRLVLSDDIKREAMHEVEGAAMQVQKDPPDKKKMAQKLKDVGDVLKEAGKLGTGVSTLATMIRKAIEWAGVVWAGMTI